MKSKYSNVVMLFAAVVAFVPVLAVDVVLDNYVRTQETERLQTVVGVMTDQLQLVAQDTTESLRRVVTESPTLCTPTFVDIARKQMENSVHLRQILVENNDRAQFCDAFGRQVQYTPLTKDVSIPGMAERLAVVYLGNLAVPAMKISQVVGSNRLVSAFAPMFLRPLTTTGLPGFEQAMLRVSMTDGTVVSVVGDANGYGNQQEAGEYLSVQSFAGEFPIRVEMAVPFATVRARYADLQVGMTIIAAILSVGLLILAFQYVRRSQLPAFDLERAIANGELKPYYQPVIHLTSGRLYGCEVLCRWEKPNGQIVPPGVFIDYAEVTGLAIPMTLSLMQQVRNDLSELCRDMPDMKVSINLFEGHFRDGTIVDDVQNIFAGSPIDYRQLVFEITERRELANSAVTNSVISGLHALGARLAMDDAGTGHSNLAYMQTLGVDIIKIDRVFVDMIKEDTTQVPVLDGLIAMARDLGTDIVAEGVETEAQALYLRARGVVLAQGFLFAPAIKPKPFVELARALNGKPKLHPSVRGKSSIKAA